MFVHGPRDEEMDVSINHKVFIGIISSNITVNEKGNLELPLQFKDKTSLQQLERKNAVAVQCTDITQNYLNCGQIV